MGVPRHRLNYYGREPIYTDATAVTAENLLDVLQKAFKAHTLNRRILTICIITIRANSQFSNARKSSAKTYATLL